MKKMKRRFLILVLSIFLVSCSVSQNQKSEVKQEVIKEKKENKKDTKDFKKVKDYVEVFNKKYNNESKKFANASFDDKNKSFNIEFIEQSKIDVSSIITLKEKSPNKINKNIKNLWEEEIVKFALNTSKEINDESITVNIINPKDKNKKIVTVKNNKLIFDFLK